MPDYRETLERHGLPLPSEDVLDCRYVTRTDDWYILTESGWYWYDRRVRDWKHLPSGPMY
jgi:hypothetical protein